MDNFFKGLSWYKTEECILCDQGQIEVCAIEEKYIKDNETSFIMECPCCDGKGFLYLKKEDNNE